MKIKRNIVLMYAIALLQGMVFYSPIATLYRQAAGVSVFQIAVIESISMALCILMELPWGIVADRIGYRKTMILCCGLYFVSKIVFWRADGFGMFLLERALLSVVIAGLSGVDVSVLYLSCQEEDAQGVFGVYNNLGTIGMIGAAGVYSLVIGERYRLAGFLTVVSYGLAALLALGLREVKEPRESRAGGQWKQVTGVLRQVFHNKRLLLLLVAVALLNETHQTLTVFLGQLQYVRSGLDAAAVGYAYMAVTVAGLLGGFSYRLTKRIGYRRLGIFLYALSAGCCGLMALTANGVAAVAGILLLRVCFGIFQPLQTQLQNQQIRGEDRATALSVNALLLDFAAIFTNVAFGRLAETRLPLAMGLGAVFCLAGMALFAMFCAPRVVPPKGKKR